jgi:hypothetical protein
MTTTTCDAVAERIALGDALGELAEHAASCERCKRLVELPGSLGATRHDVDPGLGFSARMTVGAQHRISVRRRRRVAAGLAATVAAGVIGVFLFTRSPEGPTSTVATETRPNPTEPIVAPTSDDDLRALINLADVDRSSRLSARWAHIEKPLSPYRKLLQGVRP